MAKAKKLKSGSWNVRVYDYTDEQGKAHYQSFTHELKAQAEFMAAQFKATKKQEAKKPKVLTVEDALTEYIIISATLSPTTIEAYKKIKKYAFKSIMQTDVNTLDDVLMQKAINEECRRISVRNKKALSPKTVKNEYGLLSSALSAVCGKRFYVRLPKVQKTIEELPQPEVIIKAIKGTDLELACLLAMWMSLRMSEIRGLQYSCVRKGYLYIEQTLVNVGSEDILKQTTKTDASRRKLEIPPYIMELIKNTDGYKKWLKSKENGYIVPLSRNDIYHRFKSICEKNNIPGITFHDLRHLFASISLNILNQPQKIVQLAGGWSTPTVMQNTYSQGFASAQKKASDEMNTYFTNLLQK